MAPRLGFSLSCRQPMYGSPIAPIVELQQQTRLMARRSTLAEDPDVAYQTVIVLPLVDGGQPKACRNSGVSASAPITRNFDGECESVARDILSCSGRCLSFQICA